MDLLRNRFRWVGIVLAATLLAACGGGGGSSPPPPAADTTPPTVSSTSPADSATGVAINAAITATFSEAMTASTFTTATFTIAGVTGAVTYSGTTATFTPSSSLVNNTAYTATITTAVKDSAGNAIAAPYTWNFRTGDGGGGSASSTYLFYSGSLHAVDPANPASPITVEAGSDLVSDERFISGTYNSTTKIVTNIHEYAVIYAKTDGKLYRVSALKSGSLTPVQVSSESGAGQLCVHSMDSGGAFTDLANPDNSRYVYVLPGSDGTCETGDDVWKMVRLGMGAGDAPVAAKPSVEMLFDFSTGAIGGWLVHEAGALKKCDASFAACVTVVPVTSKVDAMLGLGSNRHLLSIDNRLFVYDGDANTLSASIFTIPSGQFANADTDDTHIYFTQGKTIYKAPINGSAAASVLAVESDNINIGGITANKLVYTTGAQLKVADKASGVIAQLATAGTAGFSFSVNGNNIYYSLTGSGGVPIAGVIDEAGGGKSETPNASWVGNTTFPTSFDQSKGDSLGFQAGKIIRAEGYNALGVGKGFAGGTLKAFNAATGAVGATLGTLPDNVMSVHCEEYGLGDADSALCWTTLEITPAPAFPASPFQSDVFFINAATAGSLTRVTNTADKNEAPF